MKKERVILLNFLKSSFTHRKIDKLLGYDPKQSKGWRSWKVLKKYNISGLDRGKLFCFREQESLGIVKKLMASKNRYEVEDIFSNSFPSHLEKYRNTFIVADSNKKVMNVLGGEVRNITQNFFISQKKIIGKCQVSACDNKDLDTVHLCRSRLEILNEAIEFGKSRELNRYDVYNIMRQYLQLHSKVNSFCFLCKSHHKELTKYEIVKGKKLVDFRKAVISNI